MPLNFFLNRAFWPEFSLNSQQDNLDINGQIPFVQIVFINWKRFPVLIGFRHLSIEAIFYFRLGNESYIDLLFPFPVWSLF